jgi:hypothetical protein
MMISVVELETHVHLLCRDLSALRHKRVTPPAPVLTPKMLTVPDQLTRLVVYLELNPEPRQINLVLALMTWLEICLQAGDSRRSVAVMELGTMAPVLVATIH